MITECYIKGRCDWGVGKCAVVITEKGKLVHQVAWKVPESWSLNGETVEADQQNCEILAAIYAIKWCHQNKRGFLNMYVNTTTCQKWYMRMEFPKTREVMGGAYIEAFDAYYKDMDAHDGKHQEDRLFVEYMKKSHDSEWNWLVNDIATDVK